MNAGSEHWLDRLAAPHTRRQGFKAALAAAALTLPLARAAPAHADDPHACQDGCLWTNGKNFSDNYNACKNGSSFLSWYALTFGPGALLGPARPLSGPDNRFTAKCLDVAAIVGRSGAWQCIQDNCPGFEPSAHNGPCEYCAAAGGTCCVYPGNSDTGYFCCTIVTGRSPCWCTQGG